MAAEEKTVLTIRILEPEDAKLEKDFMTNFIESLGEYKVIAFTRKNEKEDGEGCACQRSW